MIALELPYPPSVNHYWRRVGARTLISRGGRQYRSEVVSICTTSGVQPLAGRLAIEINVHPPDQRRRDLDNVLKALLDALCHGGCYADDSQVDRLLIAKAESVDGGMARVWIREL